ncbi:MAG: GNAT family N-acetyltransferase [Anaerolineae bacterium]|nr:GNAT family N-acetyltransferase [Anaerolineae bacterium]
MSLPNMAHLKKAMPETPEKPEPVTLRDGSAVTIRPIRPDDARRLQALFDRLSPESISLRFLGQPKELPYEQAEQLANVDYQKRMALVATREQDGEEHIIAVARYAVNPADQPDLAEAAIVVEDEYQKRGLGTLLLSRLVAYAQAHGIRAFMATVHQDNIQIMRFVRHSGLPTESTLEAGVWEIVVKLEPEAEH